MRNALILWFAAMLVSAAITGGGGLEKDTRPVATGQTSSAP